MDAKHDRARVLGAFAIAFVTFAQVAGSPVGIEDAVNAGGAFGCVVVLILMAILWAIPQSLIVAELATALPLSGGVVVWVEDALGPVAGFVNTWLVLLSSMFDMPAYTILFIEVITNVWPAAKEPLPFSAMCVGVPALSFTLNLLGAEAVAASAEWLTMLVLLPFIATPLVIAGVHAPLDVKDLGPAGVPSSVQLSPLVSSIMWNMMGWGTVGALASEAKPGSYPFGLLAGVALVTGAYAWPVMWAYAAVPEPDQWSDGSFPSVARTIAPWFGAWMATAAALAALSGSVGNLASYSRQLQAAAGTGSLPIPVLTQDWGHLKVPVPALMVLAVISVPLSFVDLSSVLIFDTGCNSLAVLLLAISFLRLRWARPALKRPFRVPGGTPGALAATASIVVLVVFSLVASAIGAPVYILPTLIGVVVLVTVIGAAKHRYWPLPPAAASASLGTEYVTLSLSPMPVIGRQNPRSGGRSADGEVLPLLSGTKFTALLTASSIGSSTASDPARRPAASVPASGTINSAS